MFRKLLQSAFDGGGEVFIYMNGFNNPLRGRVQDIDDEFFTFFQNGRSGTVLWAFRVDDILSCGLIVSPPSSQEEMAYCIEDETPLGGFLENDN